MRLTDIRHKYKGEFVLIAVTLTDADNCEVLEGDVLAHSANRDDIMALLSSRANQDVTVEWCGEPDETRVVAI